MSTALIRYWFEFDVEMSSEALRVPRAGVTAWSVDDARVIISKSLFGDQDLPPIRRMVANVDIQTLDAKHVLNQMSPPNLRGVWYPMGYQD